VSRPAQGGREDFGTLNLGKQMVRHARSSTTWIKPGDESGNLSLHSFFLGVAAIAFLRNCDDNTLSWSTSGYRPGKSCRNSIKRNLPSLRAVIFRDETQGKWIKDLHSALLPIHHQDPRAVITFLKCRASAGKNSVGLLETYLSCHPSQRSHCMMQTYTLGHLFLPERSTGPKGGRGLRNSSVPTPLVMPSEGLEDWQAAITVPGHTCSSFAGQHTPYLLPCTMDCWKTRRRATSGSSGLLCRGFYVFS
jgi:hypothetical protein